MDSSTPPLGKHCILELWGCSPDLLNDEQHIRRCVVEAAEHGLSTLLNLSSHSFEPQGVTALGLLAESHLSVHTWPECGYAAVDVFTCGQTAQPEQACAWLVHALGAAEHTLRVVERGRSMEQAAALTDRPGVVEEVV